MSIAVLLDMTAATLPDREALLLEGQRTSFAQLAERAAGGAGVLTGHDAGHAVLLGRNGPVMPELLFAAAHAGIPFTPLNYRLPAWDLQRLLSRLDRPLVVADADLIGAVAAAPTLTTDEFRSAAAGAPAPPVADLPEDAVAVMLFTSGTTSDPKLVPVRHENLMSYVLSTVELGAAALEDAALVTVPPYHIAAVSSVLTNLAAGRRVVYLPDFDAHRWLQLAREEGVTSAMVVPTMLARIVAALESEPDAASAAVPTLRSIAYGGARMPRGVLERALDLFPACGFVNAYGLTETSSTITLLGPDDHRAALASDEAAQRARLGSVGRAVPGIELQIRDGLGRPVATGAQGELWVRGGQVVGEYVGSGTALDDGSWFPTKDLAHVDDDGFLFIHGRVDDTIIRGGENISPTEVEDVLLTHPAVQDVAVIGTADEEWGERLVAVVVPEGVTTDLEGELRSFARSRLRGSRTPDRIVVRDELPYSPTGKLLRRELSREVQASWQSG